jgi:hypothetical protein
MMAPLTAFGDTPERRLAMEATLTPYFSLNYNLAHIGNTSADSST